MNEGDDYAQGRVDHTRPFCQSVISRNSDNLPIIDSILSFIDILQFTTNPYTTLSKKLHPFSNDYLSSCFQSIAGIDFIFNPQLYSTHTQWINNIIPLITLLVNSFRLNYILFFFAS